MANFFNADNAELLAVYTIYAGKDWGDLEHLLDSWEFIYFTSGPGYGIMPDGRLSSRSYGLVIYPPGVPHSEDSKAMDPEKTIVFAIKMSSTKKNRDNFPFVIGYNDDIDYLVQRITENYANGETDLAKFFARAFLAAVEKEAKRYSPREIVEYGREYLKNNMQIDFEINSISDMFDLSPSYFSTLFTANFGISPIRYQRNERLKVAERLLKETRNPINRISRTVGYLDQLYFSRVFFNKYGLSPRNYRYEYLVSIGEIEPVDDNSDDDTE